MLLSFGEVIIRQPTQFLVHLLIPFDNPQAPGGRIFKNDPAGWLQWKEKTTGFRPCHQIEGLKLDKVLIPKIIHQNHSHENVPILSPALENLCNCNAAHNALFIFVHVQWSRINWCTKFEPTTIDHCPNHCHSPSSRPSQVMHSA